MSQLTTILAAVRYIEAHLRAPVTVADVADAVGYSLFHFSRTFNRIVQHTPYDYLMRRRVSASAEEVLSSARLIIDIAYDYQFANPETFTRAFRRMFGMTPSEARSSERLPYRRPMPPLTMADLAYRVDASAERPDLISEPVRALVALQTLADSENSPLVDDLWRALVAGMAAEALVPDHYYAVVWRRIHASEPYHLVAVGATTVAQDADESRVRGPLLSLRLPARQSARCPHRGSAAELPQSEGYLVHTWLPKVKLWQADTAVVLDYGDQPGEKRRAPVALTVEVSNQPQRTRAGMSDLGG